jgi:hypothetical protein
MPPDAEQLSPVMAAIYGLIPREQQVVEARRLAVHEQEYLRHIFANVGVASRGELVAALFFGRGD